MHHWHRIASLSGRSQLVLVMVPSLSQLTRDYWGKEGRESDPEPTAK